MEIGTVRSLIPAHSRTTMQWGVSRQRGIGGHFKAWWEAFQEAWIGHRQILQQRPPSYFSVLSLEWLTTTVAGHKGSRIEQFCRFCFATHHLDRFEGCGKWAQSTALYISSTCLSLSCIFHQAIIIIINIFNPTHCNNHNYQSSSSLWFPLSYISGRLQVFITLLYIQPSQP